MNKDSDGQCEVTFTVAEAKDILEVIHAEREAVVRFLRKFNGMEAVAARIEKGEHHYDSWRKVDEDWAK